MNRKTKRTTATERLKEVRMARDSCDYEKAPPSFGEEGEDHRRRRRRGFNNVKNKANGRRLSHRHALFGFGAQIS
uniref:Uncharacterized protein n=1 Tax=Caenorhabditis japonica TaxID=281687 RepID=A0A8R1EP01_CAEJA